MKDMLRATIAVAVFLVSVVCLASVFKNGDKSLGDKVSTIVCGGLCAILAILEFGSSFPAADGINIRSLLNTVFVDNSINNSFNQYIENNGLSETDTLMIIAQAAVDQHDYDKALDILGDPALDGTAEKTMAMGYLLAHGYGVNQDVAAAREHYESIKDAFPQARRNLLALLIATGRDGANDEAIVSEIEYFIESGDDVVLKYLVLCDSIKEDAANADDSPKLPYGNLTVKDLMRISSIGIADYANPPRDTGFSYFKFVGADYPSTSSNQTLPTFHYKEYRLCFIDTIDRFS